MDRKIKILINTDSHILHTGLAEATRLTFGTLLKLFPDKYDLHQLGFFHQQNGVTAPLWPITPTKFEKVGNQIRLRESDKYGAESFPEVVTKFKPDIVYGYGDPWYVKHIVGHRSIVNHSLILQLTYDGFPYPPDDQSWLKNVDKIVTLTQFSKEVIANCLPEVDASKIEIIPHASDINRFKKFPAEDRLKFRQKYLPKHASPTDFIMGWVGRNQWRKQNWKLYETTAYMSKGGYYICEDCFRVTPMYWDPMKKQFVDRMPYAHKKYKDMACKHCSSSKIVRAQPMTDFKLWIHCAPEDITWPSALMHKNFALDKEIIYTPNFTRANGYQANQMPIFYNIWDAQLYLSGGEGFGAPVLESISCGCPVIGTNYSSHAELINDSGCGITIDGILQPEQGISINRCVANIDETIEAILSYRSDSNNRDYYGNKGIEYAKDFDCVEVAKKWDKIFTKFASTNRKTKNVVYSEKI